VIEKIDQQLEEWVKNVLGPVTVSLDPPGTVQADSGVHLYLIELVDSPPPRNTKRAPLQLSLRYLVTTWADSPEEAHRLLGDLVLAAMGDAHLKVELEPLSATSWTALGIPPRPSFMLRVPIRQERPQPEVKPVLQPLKVKADPITRFSGILLGPNETPLIGATVELKYLQRSTRTDTKGRFTFPTIPVKCLTEPVRVRAKGQEFEVTLDQPASHSEPVVIRLDLLN
jgi:hypothetical protein